MAPWNNELRQTQNAEKGKHEVFSISQLQSFLMLLLLLLHDTNWGNARQSFFDEFRTKVPAHGETRETRPEVSTGRWTRSALAHGETRERRDPRFQRAGVRGPPPHMEKGEKEEFTPRFRRAGSLARSTTAIGYSLKSIGCGSWYWSGKVFDPVECRVKLHSSLRTFLPVYTCKGNMIFIIYRKILRTIFIGKTLFKGFHQWSKTSFWKFF